MNTEVLKGAFIFLCGAAAGAAITWKLLKEQYEQEAQEEIAAMKLYYEEKATLKVKPSSEAETEDQELARKNEEMKKLHRYAKPYLVADVVETAHPKDDGPLEDDCEPPEDDDVDFPETYWDPIKKRQEPYIISMDEYIEDELNHEKLALLYYEEDDTLADEQEQIVANVLEMVGPKALVSFGEGSDDPDTVYIRNEYLGIDFEVIRNGKSYKKEVLGIVDAPKAKRRKKTNDE